MLRRPAAVLLLVCGMASCIAPPPREADGLLVGAQRVLALDFSSKATGPRLKRLHRIPEALVGEMLRAKATLSIGGDHPATATLEQELLRSKSVTKQVLNLFESETKRRPSATSALWPTSFQFAQNTANGIDTMTRLIGSDRRPMSEISDRVHRTDHTNQRPELTLWQRLQRRLPW